MKKLNNKKGFTLAELLIVVAIIAVLVAISIPIFTAQLRKARLATNQANARAAYAATVADMLTNDKTAYTATYTVATAKIASGGTASVATAIQDWTVSTTVGAQKLGDATAKTWIVAVATDGTVKYSATY